MSLDELRQRCGEPWPAIARAQTEAAAQLDKVRQLLRNPGPGGASIDSDDISVVVFGSLARREWTSGSDLDWTLVIDGGADPEHANTAHRLKELLAGAFKPPGPTGVFGSMTFSHNLIHQIGGPDDTNRNTTQRMLLLLESRPVNRSEAYDRVVPAILRRYLTNDFRPFRLKVPRFLCNDVHRFWRTVCVDYASKYRERAAQGWAIRNIKLRLSRKLIVAAGLLSCLSCDPELLMNHRRDLAEKPTVEGVVEYLRSFVARPPLEIVAEALARYALPETARSLLTPYDTFLARIDNTETRARLENLPPQEAEADGLYQELQQGCRSFETALERLFFDSNERLNQLTREYGVF